MDHLEPHPTAISYEKSYECCNCGKAFAYFKRYTSHMEVCTSDSGELNTKQVTEAVKKPKTVKLPAKLPPTERSDDKDEEWHECSICDMKFRSKLELNRHSTSHSLDKPYECIECGRRFSQKNYLIKHIPVHAEGKSFSCHLCSYQVSRSDRFKIHMLTHGIQNPFKCSLCGQGFAGLKELNRHLNSHNSSALDPGANTSSYQRIGLCVFNCVECGIKFEKAEKYKQHMLKQHDVEEPYECSLCGDSFSSKLQLNKHLNNHNTLVLKTGADVPSSRLNHQKGEDSRTSTEEVKTSSTCNGYKEHLNSVFTDHSNNGIRNDRFVLNSRNQVSPVEAGACVSAVTSVTHKAKSQLKMRAPKRERTNSDNHMVHNSEIPSYFCFKCDLQLSGKLDYKLHMRSHQKKLFSCSKCGRSYTRNSNLKKHPCPAALGKISTPKLGCYKCKTCEISFSSAKDLDEHIISHVSDMKESGDIKRVMASIKEDECPSTMNKNHKKTIDLDVDKHSSNCVATIAQNSTFGSSTAAVNDHSKNVPKKKEKVHSTFLQNFEMVSNESEVPKKKTKYKHTSAKLLKSENCDSHFPKKKAKSKHKFLSQVTEKNVQSELNLKKKPKFKSSAEVLDMIENELSKFQTNLSIPTVHKKEHDQSVLEYEKLVVYEFMNTKPVLPDMEEHSSNDGFCDAVKITDELCMKFFM